MGNNIKVSVLTPIYNHNIEYVRKCLESLKAQTMRDIEFILIDNGATQESKDLIAEFETSDSRFNVIHIEQNQGYGYAMNLGLQAAKGEYIGIVESDDWVEPDMYEKLYDIGITNNVNIIKSLFYRENLNKQSIQTYPEYFLNKITTVRDCNELLFIHASTWSYLYKKSFLDNYQIHYPEEKDSIGADLAFYLQVLSCSDNIYITNSPYYHYNVFNPNSSMKNLDQYKEFYLALKQFDFLENWAKNSKNINNTDIIPIRKFITLYYLCNKKYDKLTFKTCILIHKKLKNINIKHFEPILVMQNFKKKKITELTFLIKHPVLYYCYELSKNILHSFFSIKNDGDTHKIISFCGVKAKFKKKQNKIQIVASNTGINKKEAYGIAYYFYDLQKCNIEAAAIHPDTFSQYKKLYKDKSIVVVGCGPTANYYTSENNCIHIGVNRAFLLDKVNLDYLFVQDWMDEKDMLLADKYKQDSCKKFYAVIPEKRLREVQPKIKRIPEYHIDLAAASLYVLKSQVDLGAHYVLPYDISINPIYDAGGTVFSALQFALYTQTPKIYIVGCDCSVGHFHDEGKNGLGANLQDQVFWWQKFKEHVETYYPHTEIISVNPVGLKGMFRDVYTQSYVNDHPELLEENVEILQEDKEFI